LRLENVMPKYTAIGRRYFEYKLVVEAQDEHEAYNIALESETHKWTQLEGDQVVEIYSILDPEGEEANEA